MGKSPILGVKYPGDKNLQVLKIPDPRDKNPQIFRPRKSKIFGDYKSPIPGDFQIFEKSPSPGLGLGIAKKSHLKATSDLNEKKNFRIAKMRGKNQKS